MHRALRIPNVLLERFVVHGLMLENNVVHPAKRIVIVQYLRDQLQLHNASTIICVHFFVWMCTQRFVHSINNVHRLKVHRPMGIVDESCVFELRKYVYKIFWHGVLQSDRNTCQSSLRTLCTL
jgi:hypothetical protein